MGSFFSLSESQSFDFNFGTEVGVAVAFSEIERRSKFPRTSNNNFNATNDDLLIVSNDDDSANFGNQLQLRLANGKKLRQQYLSAASRRSSDAKPRIIWSRIKHGSSKQQPASHSSDALGSHKLHDGATVAVGGATPLGQPANGNGEHLVNVGAADDEQQAAAEHMTSCTGGLLCRQANSNSAGDDGGHRFRTEVTVDWLNHLLFVLDKYRLVVMDFDGNNELLLIDDFDVHTRPVDIKVNPANDFLFWLRAGEFYNTIYRLDLNKLPKSTAELTSQSGTEQVALSSNNNAHPIVFNLPLHAKLFTIDHKHSKIYVPLPPTSLAALDASGIERTTNKTIANQRDDTEVFATQDKSAVTVTHMNSTATSSQQLINEIGNSYDVHCNSSDLSSSSSSPNSGQILSYRLDGTDAGVLRSTGEKSHLSSLDDMLDITLDSDKNYLYWLTNDGTDVLEEYKTESDSNFYSAQHKLTGKKYTRLIHFDASGSNQPLKNSRSSDSNSRAWIRMLSATTPSIRWVRSDLFNQDQFEGTEGGLASSLNGSRNGRNGSDSDVTRFSRNAPYVILGITCLAMFSVYLVYAFIFQHSDWHSSRDASSEGGRSGSIGGSSMGAPHTIDGEPNNLGGFMSTSAISKWIPKPSGHTARNTTTSTFERERNESCDTESSNYNGRNAVDAHYRDIVSQHRRTLFDLDNSQLVNLGEWPANMLDVSNKLYVPVEVLQDEALASIHRIAIDQLEISRHAPLGEGHFGTVLQGTITCTLSEKRSMLSRNIANCSTICSATRDSSALNSPLATSFGHQVVNHHNQGEAPGFASTSSGHGSSSTSSEFITATSCNAASNTNADYLTPKSYCDSSAMSDYAIENQSNILSRPDSYSSGCYQSNQILELNGTKNQANETFVTKLKVAIKKLKDNASVDEKRDFLQEAKLLADFKHPNIVQLIGICLDRGSTLIVMELMLGGDLIRYMQENTPKLSSTTTSDNLTNDDLLSICLDIVNGCCYLEERNYIHRDLAARNCLVSSRKKEERVVKLADFGLARDIYKDSYYKKLNDSAMPLKWMAPECLIEQKFTTMSDVWSFGVIMWEVMSYCQEKPYKNVEPFFMKEHLTGGARLAKPENCSEDVYTLMRNCWQSEPKDRPTFHECRGILIEINRKEKTLD